MNNSYVFVFLFAWMPHHYCYYFQQGKVQSFIRTGLVVSFFLLNSLGFWQQACLNYRLGSSFSSGKCFSYSVFNNCSCSICFGLLQNINYMLDLFHSILYVYHLFFMFSLSISFPLFLCSFLKFLCY